MAERNKVLIRSNPFDKVIQYQIWDSEESIWCELSENSDLTRDEYTKATLQNKVHDILTKINETYNQGNVGLDIIFEGTNDDFQDINDVLKNYFSDNNIKCVRGNSYVNTAETVMKEIDAIYQSTASYFDQYQSDETITQHILMYQDATRKVVPVCVMGLYSSGKSAFLNCLIGAEILPSSTDPTTAKNYRISSNGTPQISFRFGNQLKNTKPVRITLSFDKDNYSVRPNDSAKYPILRELQNEILKKDANQSVYARMYRAIRVINEYDRNKPTQNVSDLIEITVPFTKSTLPLDRYEFVFYDTPGSDSSSNEAHKRVLLDALREQTNGLPIFITTPDSMDKDENTELIQSIDQFGGALDQTNTMVVVNRSDEPADSDLDQKKKLGDDLKIIKWKSTRVYFVSSIMGLGSKKDNLIQKSSWIDDTYCKVFRQNLADFSDPDSGYYRKLYKSNIMPSYRYDSYKKEKEDQDKSGNLTDSQRVFINSGMECIEREITEFARRYALYSKCLNAKEHLAEASTLIQKKITEDEHLLQKQLEDVQSKLKRGEAELIQRIRNHKETLFSQYIDVFTKHLNSYYFSFNISSDMDWIEKKWIEIKKSQKKNTNRLTSINSKVRQRYTDRLLEYGNGATRLSREFWDEKTLAFKESCIKLVTESQELTDEHKRFLAQYIMNVPPMRIADKIDYSHKWGIVPKHFLFFRTGEKFDLKQCKEQFKTQMKETIPGINTESHDYILNLFKRWTELLIAGLTAKLAEFNPELRAYTVSILALQLSIRELRSQKSHIEDQITRINNLMEFKEAQQ